MNPPDRGKSGCSRFTNSSSGGIVWCPVHASCGGSAGGASWIGRVERAGRRVGGDGARVLTSGGSNLMFDGAWNDATGFKKTVHGFADVGMGAYVCTSGAMSGVHCWGVVDEMLHQHCDQFGCFSTIGAARYGQGIMAAVGDSGGPVLIPYTNGKVGAVGMIQGGDPRWEETPKCGSMFDSSMRCFRRVFFSSTRTIVNSIPDATLRTG